VVRADLGQTPQPAIVARAYAIFAKAKPEPLSFRQRFGSFLPLPSARQFSMALVLVLLVLSNVVVYTGIGVVGTAQDAIPGDSSYSVKLLIEDIQLATTLDTAGKLTRHLT
jgi:hypothetical protein